jgi:hypothetical protein
MASCPGPCLSFMPPPLTCTPNRGSNSSVNRDGSGTSTMGKKKRERFARSRPLPSHFARFNFRTSGKASISGLSQSLDAGDTSEMNESFEEIKVKRTSSAPSRDGSDTPPATASSSSQALAERRPQIPSTSRAPLPGKKSTLAEGPTLKSHHICVQLDEESGKGVPEEEGTERPSTLGPNLPTGSKLQGIIQPLKTSSPSSGWL